MSNFNPRSREGSDGQSRFSCIFPMIFQSTLPRRERHKVRPIFTIFDLISIHAPAKGATLEGWGNRLYALNFNPRSREGSDDPIGDKEVEGILFQSTLPRRERPETPRPALPPAHFNPRSREGSDGGKGVRIEITIEISIHAPAKGATMEDIEWKLQQQFQSTLPRRERPK